MPGTDSNCSPKKLLVCINRRYQFDKPSCADRGSEQLYDALKMAIGRRGLSIELQKSICFGQCEFGPTVRLVPGGAFFLETQIDDIDRILDQLELDQ